MVNNTRLMVIYAHCVVHARHSPLGLFRHQHDVFVREVVMNVLEEVPEQVVSRLLVWETYEVDAAESTQQLVVL